jgi:hypothetical protein
MPDEFGIDLLDDHSPPPSHGAVVLLETHAGQNYEHLIETALATHNPVHINPLLPTSNSPTDIAPDDRFVATSFSAILDDAPEPESLTGVDLVVFENADELSQFGPDLIEAGVRFMDLMADAYLLCHINPRPDDTHQALPAIRDHSDLIARITTGLHGEQFQITSNTFGPPMDSPVALDHPHGTPTEPAAEDTGRDPFGFDASLGGPDQQVATPDTETSPADSEIPDDTGDADASMSLIEMPDAPGSRRDSQPGDSPVRDGNARGIALLEEYDIRTKFDVESLGWRELTQLASDLDVAVHGGDRDTYEAEIKPIVDGVLNGDRGVDTFDAYFAAIEEPRDVTALDWEYLVYTAESLGVTPDKDTRPAYEHAVVSELFDDTDAVESPRYQSTPFNLIDPDIDDDWWG